MKRLFLFACYDADGRLTPTTDHLLSALSGCGDVVLVMDMAFAPGQEELIKERVVYCEGLRHGEYDFGSYKRGFLWAEKHLDMTVYDVLYFVNDSVIGPLSDLPIILERMESLRSETFGLVHNPHRHSPHLQTWFVGFRQSVFTAEWFRAFISSIEPLSSKWDVCVRYEIGLTRLLTQHGIKPLALFEISAKKIYNSPKRNYRCGLPFLKKDSFYRHEGSLGRQVKWVLDHAHPDIKGVVDQELRRKGKECLLTDSRLKVAVRYIRYLCGKIGLLSL